MTEAPEDQFLHSDQFSIFAHLHHSLIYAHEKEKCQK